MAPPLNPLRREEPDGAVLVADADATEVGTAVDDAVGEAVENVMKAVISNRTVTESAIGTAQRVCGQGAIGEVSSDLPIGITTRIGAKGVVGNNQCFTLCVVGLHEY
ncbi:hypothetical protein M7I_5577 [Glarea lozoyensis 74030]|uniref:Uncharacterized protein n=1 Tax=Glarea lozoyensis (strain ATCC 74030 / MF5533) TaxID=1104152 RepID=H0ES99_GLAL7|nr:hypothetical protein M7I_5577 [Glarea lozoyensis 74030]